ncbi:lauroyl acyltransferase [Paracoccus sp. S-4012]|uniref:lysophospholipid acyltransferase family protein n=1 Tax=Paracoccus sp. S-4012 TaxID=2665648 RepID=UPI0012AEF123|nr:lysophospholipid acyltransferase family protein [Paracoccus sp. S-4012]MRX51115.1 lauroyl acyltransferase [Paracoccus sp. S-4012]
MSDRIPGPGDRALSLAFETVMAGLRRLPYERRIPAGGRLFSQALGPLAGWRRRIRRNLALARPDLPREEVERLARAVPDNVGRAMAETYSGAEFTTRMAETSSLEGEGLPVLEAAAREGRPVVLACAHFGNYDALRAVVAARGWPIGGLYRPMSNPAFNTHYVPAISAIAEPVFPRGREGLGQMLRFIRGGGMIALGFDLHVQEGAPLTFFGLPAMTSLTPAELALRHDAPLIPMHAIRQPDGFRFRVHAFAPIPPGDPAAMMQACNDGLETLVRQHMDQWFWVHRRWKAAEEDRR